MNIRKFTVHVLLKPGLENFEHYFMGKYSGTNVKLDGEEYVIVRQNDILAIVE